MEKAKWCKSLIVSLVICLVISLAGCNSGNTGLNDKAKTTTETTPKTTENVAEADPYAPIEGKKYKISLVNHTPFPVDANAQMVKHWNEKFNVEFEIIQLSTSEQLNLKIASGETPDCFYINSATYAAYVKQGVLAEIPDYVPKKYMPDVIEGQEQSSPGMTELYGYIDGVRYGLPLQTFYYNDYIKPIIYNGIWMERLGVNKVPENLDEFEDLMDKFTTKDPDNDGQNNTYGLSASAFRVVFNAFEVPTFNTAWVEHEGEVVRDITLPGTKEALATLNAWYKKGIIDPTFITGENTGGYWALTHAFINEKIGVTGMGVFYHWNPKVPGRKEGENLTELKASNPELAEKIVWGKPLASSNGVIGASTESTISDAYRVFSAKIEKDKLGKILQIANELVGSPENFMTTMYGLENEKWTRNSDGSFDISIGYEDGMKIGAWATFLLFGMNRNTSYPEKALVKWAEEKNLYKHNYKLYEDVLSPLDYLPSVSTYITDLNKLASMAEIAFITGERSLDEYDDFIKEYMAAGGEILTKEANEVYTAKQSKR